jgi:hypothetical protein
MEHADVQSLILSHLASVRAGAWQSTVQVADALGAATGEDVVVVKGHLEELLGAGRVEVCDPEHKFLWRVARA